MKSGRNYFVKNEKRELEREVGVNMKLPVLQSYRNCWSLLGRRGFRGREEQLLAVYLRQ